MRFVCRALTNIFLAVGLVACVVAAQAQSKDQRLVSARAGGVNFVSGEVKFRRAGHEGWQQLATTDDLRAGDTVRTGADGHAEILLNPGSYLRLGENSEFELSNDALDALRLRLTKGSALCEATIYGEGAFTITLDTPQTQISIVRSGIYRINAATNTTELFVRKGLALVGRERSVVKEGRVGRVGTGGAVEVAKFDKHEKDTLDVWGKQRAEELAQANRKLQVRALNTALASMSWSNLGWGSNPSGLWLWNAGSRCYTYLPFFGWISPYGYLYSIAGTGLAAYCGCAFGGDSRSSPRVFDRGHSGRVNVTPMPNTGAKPSKGADFSPPADASPKTSTSKGGIFAPPSVIYNPPASPSSVVVHPSGSVTPKVSSPRDH
jgi:hypothetical protein